MAAASRKVKYTALESVRAVLQENNKERYSSIFAFKDHQTLVSYIAKQNKCVLALSSMHHNDTIEVDDRKPEIILHYNATISQTCERHEKRETAGLLFYLESVSMLQL